MGYPVPMYVVRLYTQIVGMTSLYVRTTTNSHFADVRRLGRRPSRTPYSHSLAFPLPTLSPGAPGALVKDKKNGL